MKLTTEYQEQYTGPLWDRYQIYVHFTSLDAEGKDLEGQPLKTFDEWLAS